MAAKKQAKIQTEPQPHGDGVMPSPPEEWDTFSSAIEDITDALEGLCDDAPLGTSVDCDLPKDSEDEDVAAFLSGESSMEVTFTSMPPDGNFFDEDQFQSEVDDMVEQKLQELFPHRHILKQGDIVTFRPKVETPVVAMRSDWQQVRLEFYTQTPFKPDYALPQPKPKAPKAASKPAAKKAAPRAAAKVTKTSKKAAKPQKKRAAAKKPAKKAKKRK